MNPRLLELLVKEGLVSADQAQKATAEQRRTGDRLATVLTRLGFLKEDDLLDFLSRKYGIPIINLGRAYRSEHREPCESDSDENGRTSPECRRWA